jgi:hypothetical protein
MARKRATLAERPKSSRIHKTSGRGRKRRSAEQRQIEVVWRRSADAGTAQTAASLAAAILSSEPATVPNAPSALQSGYAKRKLSQRVAPISYRDVGPFHESPLAAFDPVMGSPSPGTDR